MSQIDCDYEDEIRTALKIADTAASDTERFEWLFIALAWQALIQCHDRTFQRGASARLDAERTPTP